MGVYIKGMAMPTGNHEIIIRIQSDGHVLDQYGHRLNLEPTAILVPQHGRLIDANALAHHKFIAVDGKDDGVTLRVGWNAAIEAIMENAETIIPAEEGE